MSSSETSPLLQASNEINNRDVEAVIKDTTEVDRQSVLCHLLSS